MVGIDPVLVKAGDFLRNSDSASIPSLVPRSSGRERMDGCSLDHSGKIRCQSRSNSRRDPKIDESYVFN